MREGSGSGGPFAYLTPFVLSRAFGINKETQLVHVRFRCVMGLTLREKIR